MKMISHSVRIFRCSGIRLQLFWCNQMEGFQKCIIPHVITFCVSCCLHFTIHISVTDQACGKWILFIEFPFENDWSSWINSWKNFLTSTKMACEKCTPASVPLVHRSCEGLHSCMYEYLRRLRVDFYVGSLIAEPLSTSSATIYSATSMLLRKL